MSEDPAAWRRFMLQFAAIAALFAWWLQARNSPSPAARIGVAGLLLALVSATLIRPRWFRGWYRGGMRLSEALGTVMARVILTVLFFAVFVPAGWILRLTGYDPLSLRPQAQATTYWRPASKPSRLDQMF